MIFKVIFLLIFSFLYVNANILNQSQTENIEKIIKAFQKNNIEYPIPSIKNQEELKKRYDRKFL